MLPLNVQVAPMSGGSSACGEHRRSLHALPPSPSPQAAEKCGSRMARLAPRASRRSTVDQWTIAKLVDGAHVGSMLGKERHAIDKPFDSQEVKQRFSLEPARVDQIRVCLQQTDGSPSVSDRSVYEISDKCSGEGGHT
jgi:hypothetical protein